MKSKLTRRYSNEKQLDEVKKIAPGVFKKGKNRTFHRIEEIVM